MIHSDFLYRINDNNSDPHEIMPTSFHLQVIQ